MVLAPGYVQVYYDNGLLSKSMGAKPSAAPASVLSFWQYICFIGLRKSYQSQLCYYGYHVSNMYVTTCFDTDATDAPDNNQGWF